MYTSHELEHKNITEMGPLLRVTPKIPKIPCSAPIKMASMLVSNIQTLPPFLGYLLISGSPKLEAGQPSGESCTLSHVLIANELSRAVGISGRYQMAVVYYLDIATSSPPAATKSV